MTYNKNQECSQRAIRRNKRGRPEKKDRSTPVLPAHQDSITKKHTTKPKDHEKIAKIKEARSRSDLHSDENCILWEELNDPITTYKQYVTTSYTNHMDGPIRDRFIPDHMRPGLEDYFQNDPIGFSIYLAAECQ